MPGSLSTMNSLTSHNRPPALFMCMSLSKLQILQSSKFLKSKQSQPRIEEFFTQSDRLAHAFIRFFAGRALAFPFGIGPSSAADVATLLVGPLVVPAEL